MTKLLRVLRFMGVFRLARWLTSRRLRILCYHGISLRDEHEFNAGLFMRASTFESRMKLIRKLGLPIITLDEAVQGLAAGGLPPLATVITIDDGWYGTYRSMYPVLRRLEIPSTLYVATQFVETEVQLFNVAVQYILWRNRDKMLSAERFPDGVLSRDYNLKDTSEHASAVHEIVSFGFKHSELSDRQSLWREVCEALGEDWRSFENDRMLAFVNREELREMIEGGVDVQLHTHGHRFPPDDREEAMREVTSNQEYLNSVMPGNYIHLCYPSGQYVPSQIQDLKKLGIASGTTTKGGLNRRDTPVHELHRIIDTDKKSDLEFEARISGVMDLVESGKAAIRRLAGAS